MKKRRSRRRRWNWNLMLPMSLCLSAAMGFGLAFLLSACSTDSIPMTTLETRPPVVETRPPETQAPETVPPTEPPKPEWQLILANPWTPIPEDYEVTLTYLSNGQAVDERCYPELQEMMDACRAAGLSPTVCSAYRTQETQEALYENKVRRVMNEGYDREKALVEAAKVVALPGTSEHQLGLAMDIVDTNYRVLDDSQADTEVQKWLMAHSWEYGFILRYPKGRTETTGIIYEPWHYRYVGKEAAKEIYTRGLVLEEYLEEKFPNG